MNNKLITITGGMLLLTACATIVRGTEQQVSINTNPTEAEVQLSNGQSCTSSCTITAKRDQSLQITANKEGCHTQTASMVQQLGGGGVMLGGFIDYGTGAVYDLHLSRLWPGYAHAVVSLPDPRKGEQLILLTEYAKAERAAIIAYAKKQGIGELSIPKTIRIVDKMPLLGTGKLDYVQIMTVAKEMFS